MLLSQKAWAARVYCPAICIYGYVMLLWHPQSAKQFFISAIIFLPLLVAGLWLVFVPVEIKANKDDSFVTIWGWRSSTQISLRDIDFVQRRVSIFDTLRLKSDVKIMYIADAGNKHLRNQFRKGQIDQAT
jgi:hypothetical protein